MKTPLDTIVTVFVGSGVSDNFWLYWFSTFANMLLTLMSLVVFYNTTKSFFGTLKASGGLKYPINLYKAMVMCLTSLIFLRVAPDTAILLLWKEATVRHMIYLQHLNQFFDTLALIPFFVAIYILIRAGPLLEFQLLRQPIPSDLRPSWKMVRAPVISLCMIVLLSLLVVSTKIG